MYIQYHHRGDFIFWERPTLRLKNYFYKLSYYHHIYNSQKTTGMSISAMYIFQRNDQRIYSTNEFLLPSCHLHTANEWFWSMPTVSNSFPDALKFTEQTPLVWNPRMRDNVSLVSAFHTLTAGVSPIWPVAITLGYLGCWLTVRHMMSSVCSR